MATEDIDARPKPKAAYIVARGRTVTANAREMAPEGADRNAIPIHANKVFKEGEAVALSDAEGARLVALGFVHLPGETGPTTRPAHFDARELELADEPNDAHGDKAAA